MKNNGFTLLELLVAIFILMIGVIAGLSALQAGTGVVFISSSKLQASYLAQEGIEIVRNIKDTNWLKIHKGIKSEDHWDDNIFCEESPPYNCPSASCTSVCQADYYDRWLEDWGDEFLGFHQGRGFFMYSGTEDTKFKRKITVSKSNPDFIKVSVEVFWKERGQDFKVTAQEKLYNWR